MKFRRKLRNFGEALLVCLGLVLIPFLPRRCVMSFSRFLGRAVFKYSVKLRKIGLANVTLVYGDSISEEQKCDIIRESFTTFALLVLDLFWFTIFIKSRIKRYVVLDKSFEHFFNTSPALMVSGHLGNWEVMGQAMGLAGEPCLSIAMQLDNRVANNFLNWRRRVKGQESINRDGAMRKVMKLLRKGERVAMLLDQNVLPEDGGEFVNFFGIPVPSSKAADILAGRTGAKILPLICTADESGVYTARAYPPMDPKSDALLKTGITQAVADIIEKMIREDPGKWLWTYKRWKFIPEGEDKNKYPFYAREWKQPSD